MTYGNTHSGVTENMNVSEIVLDEYQILKYLLIQYSM